MTREKIEAIVRENIQKTVHLSLATTSNNKPWVCEVHFAFDDELNVYFVSKVTTRHCIEIAANLNVAGNIVRQHDLTEAPNGLYFEGTAEQVINPIDVDIERYCKVLGRDSKQLKEQLLEINGRRMYRISVKNWAIFGNFDGKGHAKYELSWGNV